MRSAEAAVRHGLALSVASDPVATALDLAAGPGPLDNEHHDSTMRTELGLQAHTIQSPEFAT